MTYIWVVELFYGNKWHPTVGIWLNRKGGRDELKYWQAKNPDDKFRLSKYRRVD